jgi:drug/metabolite transporter (DMT)-like permease
VNDLLLLGAVALLTASQVLQKVGAARRLAPARGTSGWIGALLSPEIVAAVACLVAGTALWLAVLYHMDVSRAFPMLSIGSIAVVLASRLYLRETVSPRRWIGVAAIAVGVALVAAT